MKRFFRFGLTGTFCVVALMLAAFVNVNASVKTDVQRPVKQFFKYAKTADEDKMSRYVYEDLKDETVDDAVTKSQKKQLFGMIKAENKKKFSYKITKTTIAKDKKSATVKVKVTYRSLYKAGYQGMNKVFSRMISYIETYSKEPSDSKVGSWLVKELKAAAKKYPAKVQTKTLSVKVKKYKSGWKIVKVTDPMMNAYSCDIIKGMEKSIDSFD